MDECVRALACLAPPGQAALLLPPFLDYLYSVGLARSGLSSIPRIVRPAPHDQNGNIPPFRHHDISLLASYKYI